MREAYHHNLIHPCPLIMRRGGGHWRRGEDVDLVDPAAHLSRDHVLSSTSIKLRELARLNRRIVDSS